MRNILTFRCPTIIMDEAVVDSSVEDLMPFCSASLRSEMVGL